jgi:hypothetical protein
MLALVGIDEGREHVELVELGRPGLRGEDISKSQNGSKLASFADEDHLTRAPPSSPRTGASDLHLVVRDGITCAARVP